MAQVFWEMLSSHVFSSHYLPRCIRPSHIHVDRLYPDVLPCRLSSVHIKREMKRLGLKFGELPDSLQQQLHQLWQQYRDEGQATAVDKIAQELPGGWNDKQVRMCVFRMCVLLYLVCFQSFHTQCSTCQQTAGSQLYHVVCM